MRNLVAVILTFNEEKHIAQCIRSVNWCDAVVVVDSYSTDRTCEIASREGALIIRHPFKGFGSQRQAAMDCIAAHWLCSEPRRVRRANLCTGGFQLTCHGALLGWIT